MNVQTPLPNTKSAAEIFPTYTTVCTAGLSSNPFFNISWLAAEEINQQGSGTEAPQHGT